MATFGVLYSHGDEANEESRGLRDSLASSMTPVTAIAFMIFTLLYVPCLATIAVLYKETQSLGWTTFSIGLSLTLAYTLALLVTTFGGGLL